LQSALPQYGTAPYVLNAYDAVWSLALAIDAVREADGALTDGRQISAALQDVTFLGAGGLIAFDENLDPPTHSSTAGYEVVHSPAESLEVTSIGRWELDTKHISGLTETSLAENLQRVSCPVSLTDAGMAAVGIVIISAVGFIVLSPCYFLWRTKRVTRSKMTYTTFISHSKNDAGETAQALHTEFGTAEGQLRDPYGTWRELHRRYGAPQYH